MVQMKTIFLFLLGCGSLTLFLALAELTALGQTSDAALRSAISQRYDAFFAAVLSKNMTQLRSVLADDFTHTDVNGRVRNRAEAEVMLTNIAEVLVHRHELL